MRQIAADFRWTGRG